LEQAQKEHAPQLLVQYLLQLSQAANSYYANHQVVNSADKVTSSHRLAIIVKISQVISAGLKVLGIKVPEKM
jgi:arginyl-tRNA synthetase